MTSSRTDAADSPGPLARLAALDTCACSDAMDKLGVAGTVRASLGVYNDRDDIDALAAAVEACQEMFLR